MQGGGGGLKKDFPPSLLKAIFFRGGLCFLLERALRRLVSRHRAHRRVYLKGEGGVQTSSDDARFGGERESSARPAEGCRREEHI